MTDQELDLLLNRWETPEPPLRLQAAVCSAAAPRPRFRPGWLVLAGAAGLLSLAGFLQLGPQTVGSSQSDLAGGARLRTTTFRDPGFPALIWASRFGGAGAFGPTHARRYVYDRTSSTYVGYMAHIASAGTGAWTVTVEPVTAPPPGPASSYRQMALPSIPPPRLLHEGEAFDVELSASPHLFDRLEISTRPFEEAKAPLPPRYLGAEMRFAAPRLTMDGQFLGEGPLDARGLSLWFELPGQGRYTFVVQQDGNPRFVQAGTVEGKVLEFRANGHKFRLESRQPIAEEAARPLYVLYESGTAGGLCFGSGGPAGLLK